MVASRNLLAKQGYQASPRERAGAMAVAAVTTLLVFLIMWRMGAVTSFGDGKGSHLTAIDLSADGQDKKKAEKQEQKQQKQAQKAVAAAAQPVTAPPPVPVPGKVEWPEGFIELSRNDYRATDVSKMKRADSGGGQQASAGAPGDSASVGQGPGGTMVVLPTIDGHILCRWHRLRRSGQRPRALRELLQLVACAADGEALFIQQVADAANHQHLVVLVVAPVAAPLDGSQLGELLLPVTQHMRFDAAQLGHFTDGEVALGGNGGQWGVHGLGQNKTLSLLQVPDAERPSRIDCLRFPIAPANQRRRMV